MLGTLPENYHPTFALALAPDDKQLAIGRGNRIALHSTASTNFALLKDFKAHRDVVRSLAWSRDGRFLASGSFREITLWDAATLSRLWSTQSLGRVTALHFTATGDALIAADSSEAQSGWVRLFSTQNGASQSSWLVQLDYVCSGRECRDWAASGHGDQEKGCGSAHLYGQWGGENR